MAKALIGYLGGPDPMVAAQIARRLRVRVRDLEDEVPGCMPATTRCWRSCPASRCSA